MPSVSAIWTSWSDLAADRFLSAVDRSFLGSVKDNFGSWGLTPGNINIILGTIAAASVLLGGGILINRWLASRKKSPIPSHWVYRKNDLMDLFDTVQGQRAKVELSFLYDGVPGASRACSLEEVKYDSLTLEVSSLKEANASWIGRQAQGRFRLANPRVPGRFSFYTMDIEILGLKKLASGAGQIEVSFPEKAELQQKRQHLRLDPPPDAVKGLAIWPEQLNSKGRLELRFKKWGKPAIMIQPSPKSSLRLTDISAGGLRLELDTETIKRTGMNFEIGDHKVMILDVADQEEDKKLRFWLTAKVRSRYEEHGSKNVVLGMQFTHSGQLAKDPKGTVTWKKLGEYGLESLDNWIVQRHLEMFREKGIS